MCGNSGGVFSIVPDSCRVVDTIYGRFVFANAGTLERVTVVVRPHTSDGRKGLYCTVGYTNIIEMPGCADINGIPVWLPRLGRCGCWGKDGSLALYLYSMDVKLNDVESDPDHFVCFQAGDDCCFTDVWEMNESKAAFDFIPDDLLYEAETIVQSAMDMQRVDRFISLYEPVLLQNTLCTELVDGYAALVLVYKFRAQMCLTDIRAYSQDARVEEIIGWYERCLPFIDQYQVNGMVPDPVFSDVFLLLSFWCSDAGRFEEAFGYADRWLAYDPSIREAYDELYRMLLVKRQLGAENFEGKLDRSL